MHLALSTLAAAIAVAPGGGAAPQPELEYALPTLRAPCVDAPCGGVLLADLAVDLGEPGGPRAGKARALVEERLYLGLEVDEIRRALTLSTARWDLELDHQDDRTGLAVEHRGRHLRLRGRADAFAPEAGDGWRLEAGAAVRLNPDLELVFTAREDDRSRVPFERDWRPTSSLSLGALWQRGARFELGGRLVAETVATPGGSELDRRALDLNVVHQARRWRLDGGVGLHRLSGRFDREEVTAEWLLSYRLWGHLVARVEAGERYEPDLGSLERRLGAGVTYYARRYRFARGGAAGQRTVELARRALEEGFNERRTHDLEGRRRLRQRLALAGAREALAPLIDDLHRAQIDERNVALAGARWRGEQDTLDGSESDELEIFVAVPWPREQGPHPLTHDEAATDFLRFSYRRTERDISSGFTTEGSRLAIDVALRRELALRFEWDEPAATGLEFALRSQRPRAFSARLLYRQGI